MASILDKTKYRTGKKRQFSAIIEQVPFPGVNGGAGGFGYNRQEVLSFLHEYSDKDGFLTKPCRTLAEMMGIHYPTLSDIISEFVSLGYMRKYGEKRSSRFRILHHPDDCDWGPAFEEALLEVRRKRMATRKDGTPRQWKRLQNKDENNE